MLSPVHNSHYIPIVSFFIKRLEEDMTQCHMAYKYKINDTPIYRINIRVYQGGMVDRI